MQPKLLFIGPRTTDDKRTIGGTTVSFETLLNYLNANEIQHSIIPINKYLDSRIMSFLYILLQALIKIPLHQTTMLNVNPRGAKFVAPILYLYTRLWNKNIVFRMFGGDMKEFYEELPAYWKTIFRKTFLKSDIVYLQTKRLIHFFEKFSKKPMWLPTSRVVKKDSDYMKSYKKRFVFISQIKETKGIDLLIEVKRLLPEDYVLDIYGPILEEKYENLKSEDYYKGALKPEEVIPTLKKYNVMLLPTYHPGEGYPGIIIEANSCGLPVITTNWLALPELVLDGDTGIIIEPKSTEALLSAIFSITDDSYDSLSKNAYKWIQNFDSDAINRKLLNELLQLK